MFELDNTIILGVPTSFCENLKIAKLEIWEFYNFIVKIRQLEVRSAMLC